MTKIKKVLVLMLAALAALTVSIPLSVAPALADQGRGGGSGNSGRGRGGDDVRIETNDLRHREDRREDRRIEDGILGQGAGVVVQERRGNEDRGGRGGVDEPRLRVEQGGKTDIRNANLDSIASTTPRTLHVSVLGTQLTVDASGARLLDRDENPIAFSDLRVGDKLRIRGFLDASASTPIVRADKVIDRSIEVGQVPPPGLIQQRIRELSELIARLQEQLNRLLGVVDMTAPAISSVTVTGITSATATVNWTTNEVSTSKVFFSTTSPVNLATASSVSNNAFVLNHSLTLTGLTASTSFFFVIESRDAFNNAATSSQSSFTTLP